MSDQRDFRNNGSKAPIGSQWREIAHKRMHIRFADEQPGRLSPVMPANARLVLKKLSDTRQRMHSAQSESAMRGKVENSGPSSLLDIFNEVSKSLSTALSQASLNGTNKSGT